MRIGVGVLQSPHRCAVRHFDMLRFVCGISSLFPFVNLISVSDSRLPLPVTSSISVDSPMSSAIFSSLVYSPPKTHLFTNPSQRRLSSCLPQRTITQTVSAQQIGRSLYFRHVVSFSFFLSSSSSSSFFLFSPLSSAVAYWMSTVLPHMM